MSIPLFIGDKPGPRATTRPLSVDFMVSYKQE
jgi:hypothetical protein